jgi:hypothetical protein
VKFELIHAGREEAWLIKEGVCKECGEEDVELLESGMCEICWGEPICKAFELECIKLAIAQEKYIPLMGETNRVIATENLRLAKIYAAEHLTHRFPRLWDDHPIAQQKRVEGIGRLEPDQRRAVESNPKRDWAVI